MIRWITTIVLFPAAFYAQEAATYKISGRVINILTGDPVARVRVSISPYEGREPVTSQVTSDNGRFVFANLPANKYHLIANRNGAPTQVYGQWLGAGFGTSIVTGPGQNTEDLTFRFSPPAVISGRILDDAGEPVRNALVQLLMSRIVGGRRRVVSREWLWTKDIGEYRFSQLPAGSYYIAVTARPWFVDRFPRSPLRTAAYAPAFYSNTQNAASAEVLHLKFGEEAVADFRLTSVNGASVNVTLGGRDEQEAEIQLIFHSIMGNETYQNSDQAVGTVHIFRGVPPGRYTVRATSQDRSNSASISQEFEVNGADVNLDLSSGITSTISGTVQVEGGDMSAPTGAVISLVNEESYRGFGLEVTPRGTFTSGPVPAGRYRVRIYGARDMYIRRISGDGVDADGIVKIRETDNPKIKILLTSDVGRVKGQVYAEDRAVAGALAVLAPERESSDSALYRPFQTDSDGSFDFRAIPAGNYRLFAVEDGSDLEYANPVAIRPFMERAKLINVAAKSVLTERIDLLQSK